MRKFLAEFRSGATADGPILLGLLAVWVLSVALLAAHDINGLSFPTYLFNFTLYFAGFFVAIVVALAMVLVRHRPEKPIGFLAAFVVTSGFASRLARGAPMLAALVVFLPIFSKMKAAIPLFNSYTWDRTWIDLDVALHGADPWRLLQPFLGYPFVTSMISVSYHFWILLVYVGAIYFCFFQTDRQLRARFFIAYFACWAILGVVMATAFASVGPCFAAPLLDNHRFDEQMAYLRSANEVFPVWVLPVQDALVAALHSSDTGLGRGISAMPSMHVSLATLFFLAMRKVSKFAGVFFGLFLLIILIGSVHLAYHYAVDGYVAIAVTCLIWMASGPLSRRMTDEGASS